MKQVNLLRKAQCWSKKRAYTAPPPKHALVCQNCGNSFFASHSDAKFCSNDCRVTNWRYSGKMIVTARMVRQEEGLHDPRPHVCDTSRFGYCVPCRLKAIQASREKVRLTEEATRKRTRRNYHVGKAIAAVSGD
jgi:hypothetical protein